MTLNPQHLLIKTKRDRASLPPLSQTTIALPFLPFLKQRSRLPLLPQTAMWRSYRSTSIALLPSSTKFGTFN
ncbi:MAG: hypothetical protein GVY04_10300 [Cyanobacteria bacterium]|nr:hypothetical protein [Cyanobacteria bacterium GSL.Bin1]